MIQFLLSQDLRLKKEEDEENTDQKLKKVLFNDYDIRQLEKILCEI